MNAAQHILILGLRIYRWVISPAKSILFGPLGRCRFTPSCSEYALEAVRKHGASGGCCLAAKRILRCHPWGGCGEDPVPPAEREIRDCSVVKRGNSRQSLKNPEIISSRLILGKR